MSKVDGIKPPFIPIGGVNGLPRPQPIDTGSGPSSFHDLLKAQFKEEEQLQFSAHAQSRMKSRNIELDSGKYQQLVSAMDRAAEKGAHESLVLMDQTAFIINVDSRTVITAMDQEALTSKVFTNIDSAIIVSAETDTVGIDKGGLVE